MIVATPDLPQGGSGDQKPPKRRPWRGTPLDVQRRRISDEEADVRGETRRVRAPAGRGRHENFTQAAHAVGVSKRTGKAWRNGRTRATGRNEKPLVDWYRSTMDKPKPLHPRYLSQEERIQIADRASGRFDPRHRPPAGPRPRHGQPRGRAQQESRVRRLRALPRPAEGRGPAQTPQTAQGGRGHATVGRDRRRVAQALEPGADSQPAEAGLPG